MKIAITGGIGSGKSFVCKQLWALGIAVYDCDAAAKRLMRTSLELRQQLIDLVGEAVYQGNVLQKSVLATFLLKNEGNKQAVNNIVHPAVANDFNSSGLEWLESAILFESGFNRRVAFDFVVCVSAPEAIRVNRIMHRDHISEQKARAWIARQMQQEEVERLSDFVILNDGRADLDAQIGQMLNKMEFNKTNQQ